ncbi:efflux RND transporter periplasmic adaptor subunit [Gammaproteobacteria bacterium]|nr:efflux RND transporter periplasmic adaptor subunit [Gammaproteobacteria bacterium]
MKIIKPFRHIAIAVGVILIGLTILVVLRVTAPSVAVNPIVEKVWPVATEFLQVASLRPEIREYGTVIAGSQADLRPLVSGRVIEVGQGYFEGSIVKKGQFLAKIDPFDYEIKLEDSKAALTEVLTRIAEIVGEIKFETKLLKINGSQLAIRKRDLERRRKLEKRGSTSRKSLDDAEIAYNDAAKSFAIRQQVALRLNNRLDQQKASEVRARSVLKQAERNIQETIIKAPFDGFLANANVSAGQRISTNDRLARLIEAKRLEVKFRLSEREFSSLVRNEGNADTYNSQSSELIGKEIKVIWNIGMQEFTYIADIQRVGAEIDVSGGGVDVYAKLKNINLTTPLRPGAFVQVIVPSKVYQNVAKVPDTAVVRENVIYLIENGRVKETIIKQVRRDEDYILIRGAELDGKIIITRPFPKISDGLLVESK